MKRLTILLCCIVSLAFLSCHDGSFSENAQAETSAEAGISVDGIVGKWERQSAEVHYDLSVNPDGTGKLVSYEQSAQATIDFTYTVMGEKIVFKSNKLIKDAYHAVLTTDGKYLVLDNGSSVYVYKRRER